MLRRRSILLLLPTVIALLAGIAFLSLYRADLSLAYLHDRYTDDESRFVDVGNLRVHYRLEGGGPDAPVLVLLHGTGASLHTWDGWVPWLAPEFRILRMDLPGFGLTGPAPDDDYTIGAYVRFVTAMTRQLGIERFHLAGNSLGGRIAWNVALAAPARVQRLVLIDAGGYPGNEPDDAALVFRLARLPVFDTLLARLTPRELVELSLVDAYGDPSRLSPEVIDRYFELSRRPGNREAFIEVVRDAAASEDGDVRQIVQPTLILWGAEDRWIPLANGRRFARDIPESRLIVYPGVGHVPMEEVPGPTARATAAFLGD